MPSLQRKTKRPNPLQHRTNLFNCTAGCSGTRGRYRPDPSGTNADKSPLPCI